jgi:hypothetical protein
MAAHRQHRAARDVGYGMNDLALLAYRRGECRGSPAGPVASRCAVALAAAISFARTPRALLVGWYQVERAGAAMRRPRRYELYRRSAFHREARRGLSSVISTSKHHPRRGFPHQVVQCPRKVL